MTTEAMIEFTTNKGDLELDWELDIEAEPVRPATWDSPAEGGVWPDGDPVLVRAYHETSGFDKETAELVRGKSPEVDAALDKLAEQHAPPEWLISKELSEWQQDAGFEE